MPKDNKVKLFEAHIAVLRNAQETDDERLVAIGLVRLASAAMQMATQPRFADHAKSEWQREKRIHALARWLNGEQVTVADLRCEE